MEINWRMWKVYPKKQRILLSDKNLNVVDFYWNDEKQIYKM
jgi:hypothetical protein